MSLSRMKITVQEDGTLKIDSREVDGDEQDILKLLRSLGEAVGGAPKVEKHIHGAHTHIHRRGSAKTSS